jgi:hypothetical protein
MSNTSPKRIAPPLSEAEAKRMSDMFDNAIERYQGGGDELETAIGMYVIGRHYGWRVLYILHSKKTIAKYELILGISVRDEFPEEGPAFGRSVGYRIAKTFSNFWKVVSGDEKVPRDQRKALE